MVKKWLMIDIIVKDAYEVVPAERRNVKVHVYVHLTAAKRPHMQRSQNMY